MQSQCSRRKCTGRTPGTVNRRASLILEGGHQWVKSLGGLDEPGQIFQTVQDGSRRHGRRHEEFLFLLYFSKDVIRCECEVLTPRAVTVCDTLTVCLQKPGSCPLFTHDLPRLNIAYTRGE